MNDRRKAIRRHLDHVMWTIERDGPAGRGEYATCSCGWTGSTAVTWHDDVVISEIAGDHHATGFILVSPPELHDQCSSHGVTFGDRRRRRIPARDLEWLLAQPELPEEFRRAAAVHLPPAE